MSDPIEKSVDTPPSIIGSILIITIIIIVNVVGLPILLSLAFMLGYIGGSVLALIFYIILILIMLIRLIQFLSEKFLGGTWEFKKILYIEIILIVIIFPFL